MLRLSIKGLLKNQPEEALIMLEIMLLIDILETSDTSLRNVPGITILHIARIWSQTFHIDDISYLAQE